MKMLFSLSHKVYVHVSRKFIKLCASLIHKKHSDAVEVFAQEALKFVNSLLKNGRLQEEKLLAYIY